MENKSQSVLKQLFTVMNNFRKSIQAIIVIRSNSKCYKCYSKVILKTMKCVVVLLEECLIDIFDEFLLVTTEKIVT